MYSESSRRILQGNLPYRDFALEYPPLAIVPFTLPRVMTGNREVSATIYRGLFLLVMVICSSALAWTIARSCTCLPHCKDPVRALLVYAVAVSVLGAFLAWRFDLFPALLTGLAFLVYLHHRPGAAGALLGLGIAAKLYPVVLGPVFCAEALARRDYKGLVWFATAAFAVVGAAFAPFAVLAPAGLARMLEYHAERGLEVGSVPAGLGMLAGKLGFTSTSITFRFGSVETAYPWSAATLKLLPIVTAVALLLLAYLAYIRFRADLARDAAPGPAVAGYLTLSLLAFTITSKVLSPQYMAWLLPFFPLLPRRHVLWLLTACAMTTAIFPWQFVALLEQRDFAVFLLNARNALLIIGSLWLLRDVLPRQVARSKLSA